MLGRRFYASFKTADSGPSSRGGYRRWFEQQALDLGLKGYVKNLSSGDVEAVILGSELNVNQMLQLSLAGPAHANVASIEQTELKLDDAGFADFKMIRD